VRSDRKSVYSENTQLVTTCNTQLAIVEAVWMQVIQLKGVEYENQ
jgi:hypothetical protein